jgi:hypothetical protein
MNPLCRSSSFVWRLGRLGSRRRRPYRRQPARPLVLDRLEPPSALGAFADLWGRLGPRRGLDYALGRRLFRLALAGFPAPEITFNQPVVARGETKRFLELSVAEAGPAFIDAGLITAEALASTLAAMRRLNADETVLAVMPRMAQVWARKPAPQPPGVARGRCSEVFEVPAGGGK